MLSTIVFVTLMAFTVWQLIVGYRAQRAIRVGDARPSPADPTVFRVDPCTELPTRSMPAARSAEGTIVARLLAGGIDREHYRRAMTRLAAEDSDTQSVSPRDP